jgi:carbonic anhydrase
LTDCITPRQALELLQAGNQRFATGKPLPWRANAERRAQLVNQQNPFACVITCSDSRVGPELVFDQSMGDLFVVRNAGTILTPEVIGSVEFAVEQLGASVVVIMAHSNCGAIAAAVAEIPLEGAVASVVARLQPFVTEARTEGFSGTELQSEVSRRNSRALETALAAESLAIARALHENRVDIHHAFFDIATGKVEWDY